VENVAGGQLLSHGAAATVSFGTGFETVQNSGLIENAGAGAAITAVNAINLTNAGGIINGDVLVGAAGTQGLSSEIIEETRAFWEERTGEAVSEEDAREAIRKGRLLCKSSAYATPFDRDNFDALERRLEGPS